MVKVESFFYFPVCPHMQKITWTCQSISQCKPFHRPHQDPAPKSQLLHPQIAASEMRTTHPHMVKCYYKLLVYCLCSMRWFPGYGTVYVKAYGCWVALQGGVNVTQIEQLVLLQKACFNPHGVQGRSSVTLCEKKQPQINVIFVILK